MRTSVVLAALYVTTACVQNQSTDLKGFGNAAATLGKQSGATFGEANSVGRAASIEDFVQSAKPGLNEQQFLPMVTPDVVRAWSQSLSGLERYGLLLGSLSDQSRGQSVTTAFGALGTDLKGLGVGISPGVASGFADLGGVLVNLETQRRARAILRQTDPAVRRLLQAMAEAIGAGDEDGLAGTVRSAWTRSLTPLQVNYALAVERHDQTAQRQAIATYLDGIDHRDADLRSLAAFRVSLLALADAHTAAAAGSRRPFAEMAAMVEDGFRETLRTFDALKKERAR